MRNYFQDKETIGTIITHLLQTYNIMQFNSLLILTTVREKYVKMYKRFLNQLRQYSQAIRVLSKRYLPITLLSPSKLNIILQKVRETVQKENKDYDILLK